MRRSVQLAVAAAALSLACSQRDAADRLASAYPRQADRILAGERFAPAPSGYASRSLNAMRRSDAIAAALARGGLRVELPRSGAAPIVLEHPAGLRVELRELGSREDAVEARGAIAYQGRGATSYWSATAGGYEEWLLVDDAGEAPVAEWDVRGGVLRERAGGVDVLDGAGVARLRVTAPAAVRADGSPARAWLVVAGSRLALHTDARGPALVDPQWSVVGSVAGARGFHTATLLSDGRILVAGGYGVPGPVASASIYDPATGAWTTTGALNAARYDHTATLLPDGKVLVAGGAGATAALSSTEVYDPASGTWSVGPAMASARQHHTASRLPDGRVLVAGGYRPGVDAISDAAVFDPATTTWKAAAQMSVPREGHAASVLPDGTVLVSGGAGASPVDTAETYDPAQDAWTATGPMGGFRYEHAQTLLATGKVLIAGGSDGATALATAEVFDPATRVWSATGALAAARTLHAATLLPGGEVLVTGGDDGTARLDSAERYDPSSGTWLVAPAMTARRYYHTATLLPDGDVLIAFGGTSPGGFLASAEVYAPGAGSWAAGSALGAARSGATATLLPSGKVLVTGGTTAGQPVATALLRDPGTGAWSSTGVMATARARHSATLLGDGTVLVAGGRGASGALASAELYDPATGGWSTAGAMASAREDHVATLLATGHVLVTGGGASPLASAELYDPATRTWSPAGTMATARRLHTATLLRGGRVLVAGGAGASGAAVASAELFDPSTGAWTGTGALAAARDQHTATLLPDGTVAVAGGRGASGVLTRTERWNPTTGTWADLGALAAARASHTATALPSGKVLVTGGEGTPAAVASAEVLDPATGAWTAAGDEAVARAAHAAVLLPDGRVLLVGGTGAAGELASTDVHAPDAASTWHPVLTAPATAMPGASIALQGTRLTGVSEGSSGRAQSSGSDALVVRLVRQDGGAVTVARTTAFTATTATAVVPASTSPGWHWLSVVVNGVPSDARPVLLVEPIAVAPASPSTPPRGAIVFSATGGSGSGYVWSLATNTSGARISSGGSYVAGSAGGTTDVVQVADSAGNVQTVEVRVTAGVTISPAVASARPGGTIPFSASGGSGTGFAWSFTSNGSGASIDATGRYTAGATGGATDQVRVIDSLGNVATRTVTVTAASGALAIAPASPSVAPRGAIAFAASGGTGTGLSWTMVTSGSGGRIDAATGAYVAGAVGGTADVVRVTDSGGATAEVTVTVTGGLAIAPVTATTPPRGSIAFGATGGSGEGYVWSLQTRLSGGAITASGLYAAGPTGGVADVVSVRDSLGNVATRAVTVTPGVSIAPSAPIVQAGASRTLTASGGSGTGFVWSLVTNRSGGSVGSAGVYTAGPTSGVADTVRVTDSLGNSATVDVTVAPQLTIAPEIASAQPGGTIDFTASGGTGTGYVWTVPDNRSGGTIDRISGKFTAGTTGGVTDVVQVEDSDGNVAQRIVGVAAPAIVITPAAPTVAANDAITFSATGGSGAGYAWSMSLAPSGGRITASGVYTAGATGGVTDVVKVVDSGGNAATVLVKVTADSPIAVTPAAPSVPPRGTVTLTAAGGGGTGYTWRLASSPSGGSITAAGAYTAGATGDVTDVAEVTDLLGHVKDVDVRVTAGLSIEPATASVPRAGSIAFTATGGSGAGLRWELVTNASGATLSPGGLYVAGATADVTDVVRVTDSLGNTATRDVAVTSTTFPAISITPSNLRVDPGATLPFAAAGGTGTGFRWMLETNASGGTITLAGYYKAGPTSGVVDVVRVTDSVGNTATAKVQVGGSAGGGGGGGCSSSGAGGWVSVLAALGAAARRRRLR